jgi:hypothetical protein
MWRHGYIFMNDSNVTKLGVIYKWLLLVGLSVAIASVKLSLNTIFTGTCP